MSRFEFIVWLASAAAIGATVGIFIYSFVASKLYETVIGSFFSAIATVLAGTFGPNLVSSYWFHVLIGSHTELHGFSTKSSTQVPYPFVFGLIVLFVFAIFKALAMREENAGSHH